MVKANTALVNFSAGELSPKMKGRFELPIYHNGCEILRNFIPETQGPAKFRTGTIFVNHTRRNKVAALLPFQFNDEQSYIIEVTEGYMRFFRNEAFITESAKNITDATKADPVVITSNSHGYSNGDEVFIEDVGGMTELNGKTYLVASATSNTFALTDQDGNNTDGSSFTTYTSGGTVKKIVEIQVPYKKRDLFELKYAQNADVMYIVHPDFEPRKLTRSSHTNWSLDLFTRTSDPFLNKKTITGITQANPGVVTSTAHGYSNGDEVIIEDVSGMTEVNGGVYIVANKTANDFELTDRDGNNVDTTSFPAYSSGGYASNTNLLPGAIAFHDASLFYGGSDSKPRNLWKSRAPQDDGTTRYDDFTTGTDDDHAVIFNIAESSRVRWLASLEEFLAIGDFNGIFKATGDSAGDPITPTSINIKTVDFLGVANQIPSRVENMIIYTQRGKFRLNSFEFDVLKDDFLSIDRNLVADHITDGNVKQIAYQGGRPDVLWAVKENGDLIGLTFKSKEDVSGWHPHSTGGSDHLFLSLQVMPRENNFDQMWFVVERVINGSTRRYIEYFDDYPTIPRMREFFTATTSNSSDQTTFLNAMFEAQKLYIHMDSALTYDGTVSSTTVTPGATTGNTITFTAGASVFQSTDVGREIWKKYRKGVGGGRAEIVQFNSAMEVICNIKSDFDNTNAIAAGNWFLTTDEVDGLDHLEGETVRVLTDGAVHTNEVVSDGKITLDYHASFVHVGLGFIGILMTMPLEIGGVNGPSQSKPRNIHEVAIRFEDSLGAKFGTDLYRIEDILFRETGHLLNRPPPLFSGVKRLSFEDSWEIDKQVVVLQEEPLPCIVQMIVPYATTSND